MHGTERNIIFTYRKFVTIYAGSNLHEKTEFCKNIKFGSVYYGSCFNVGLSCYTLQIYFIFKKLILRKEQVQPVLITLCKVLCRPTHISIKC